MEQKECGRRAVLACRAGIGFILAALLVGAVQSQPAALLAFLSPQGKQEESSEKLDAYLLNAAVFGPSPAPSPLPSPITALSNPDILVPPFPSQRGAGRRLSRKESRQTEKENGAKTLALTATIAHEVPKIYNERHDKLLKLHPA